MNSVWDLHVPYFVSLFLGMDVLEMGIKLALFSASCWASVLGRGIDLKSSRKLERPPVLLEMKACLLHAQMTPEFQDELMCILRSQQRELSELRQNQMELLQRLTDHLDAIQSSLMGHVERVIDSQQEQERILVCKCYMGAKGLKAVRQTTDVKKAEKVQGPWWHGP